MRRRVDSPAPPLAIPDGWYPIHASAAPPAAATRRHDGLGLARGVHPAHIRVPRILPASDSDERRESPRHRRLQMQQQKATVAVADAFAPNRSLRLASLQSPRPEEQLNGPENHPPIPPHCHHAQNGDAKTSPRANHIQRTKDVAAGMSSRARGARLRESPALLLVPLHEAVGGFDNAVDASPLAESNQVAVTELFAANWMDRFERERRLYKSIALHAEIAFRELYRLTANVASPNDVITAFACKIFDDMAEHFGPYTMIMQVLSSELRQAIYAPSAPPLPYYAIVKNQKRILISLRKDQLRRQERNDFLRYEIDKVHDTFLHFLDQCGVGLVRTIFREWYSVAVVSKRNSRKYVEYFSAWFGGSVKSMVPRLFLAWKGLAVESRVARMQEQLASDHAKLASVQKQIEELTVQRDLAQLESLAVRNDRKHAEDAIQRLHRKIQSASAFLEDSAHREALVGHEGQLRVEAVTFLPPLVLESLLRGFHSVGFLQPVHSEFVAESGRGKKTTADKPDPPKQPTDPMDESGSALRQCVAALQASSALHSSCRDEAVQERPPEGALQGIALYDCLNYVQNIRMRVEDDPTAHLLFLPKAELASGKEPTVQGPLAHPDASEDNVEESETPASHRESPLGLQELVRHFNTALQNVRRQDEHYARHAKLFSSRMLEQSEISVVPHTTLTPPDGAPPSPVSLHPNQRVAFSSIDNARVAGSTSLVTRGLELIHDSPTSDTASLVSLDQLPLLQAHDLELSAQHTRAFVLLTLGQLLLEYGSLLFSPTDLTAFVRNRMLHKVMFRGIAGGKHTLKRIHVPASPPAGQSQDDGSTGDDDDDDDDSNDERGDSIADLAPHESAGPAKKPRGGALGMLRKQTTQRRMQVVARRVSSYRGLHASLAREIDSGLSHLKTAYDLWNRLSQQLILAGIVAARGTLVSSDAGVAVAVTTAPIDPRASAVLSGATPAGSGASGASIAGAGAAFTIPEKSPTPIAAMRPRLQVHIEPLPGGPLMSSAKERDRSEAPTTPSGSHRRSMAMISSAADWSYQNSKLRQLSLDDTSQLLHAVRGVHAVVRSAAQQRANHFTAAKTTLRDVRAMQWLHASDLASQFTSNAEPIACAAGAGASASEPAAAATLALEDDRRHVFECVTFENEAIERLFSVEDHPEDELLRVQMLLERKKHVVRHALYCKHRAGSTHAASLDDLWHVVKVLRLPRDVRVLPTLRDDELVGGGTASYINEQLFSPDDVAEVLLQLCNEQFLPHITPLSARVEHLVAHHLPLAMQNQSAIREIMHKSDVKKALADHGHTLRTIFRRYCAKEKDLLAAAAAKRRAAVVAATTSSAAGPFAPTSTTTTTMYTSASMSTSGSSTTLTAAVPAQGSAAPQGITKFMRLADWHEFIADYKLLRARFTAEYATVVFCNVQEAESGLEDNLEMIYSEFTEAIVALSVCFFPDPFLRHATRVHQFIRRYLPVSPEEIRDHHV